ncbi:MAG: HD-GYP domain-containing protein [Bacillota bacterium]|nr:HD-GYP domain-containing protein [Bacillota bacterium]
MYELDHQFEMLTLELEESQELAKAKERLLLVHIAEMEVLYDKLNEKVNQLNYKNLQLNQVFLHTIESLALTLEAKDYYTKGHSRRVSRYCEIVAAELGLALEQQQEIKLAGLLHDIGKIGIKENVLCKPGRLTDEEYSHIKEHPFIGARILKPLEGLGNIINSIKFHHERIDGKGYPFGLRGAEIPLGAKIIACADTFDAMTTDRPYRKALKSEVALTEIKKVAGEQLDKEIAMTFCQLGQEGKLTS